jgi:lambda family phage tail tape measure protein
MATIDNYKIKIEVDGEDQVNSLNKSLQNADASAKKFVATSKDVDDALDKIGRTASTVSKVTGSAFALIAGSAIKMADGIKDVADAFGTTTGFVLALSQSLEEAGGSFGDAGKILTEFYKTLDEATGLNEKSQKALVELGITLDDLKTKTPTQVFQKAIEQLAGMEAGAQRTALGIAVFGKAFAQIDPSALQKALDTKDLLALQVEMNRAAEAVAAMEHNFRTLQMAALSVLEPLIGKVENMRLSAEQAEKIIKILGVTFALAFGVKTITGLIEFNRELKNTALIANTLGKNPILKLLAGGALALGLGSAIDNMMAGSGATTPAGATDTSADKERGQLYEKLLENQQQIADQQTRSNEQLRAQNSIAIKYQQTINGTIGVLDEQAKRTKMIADIDKETANQKLAIQQKIRDEEAKGGYTNNILIAQYKEQIKIIEKQADAMKILKQVEITNLEAQIARKDYITQQNELLKLQLDNATEILRADQMRQVIAGEISEKDMARTLEIAKIQIESAKRVADLRRDLENATSQLEKNRIMESISLENQRAQAAIDAKNREITEKTALEQSYNAGVIRGLEQIAEQFKPINMAQKAVNDTWGTISNSVDTFVNTGKFKFSDFARSIVADLAKMIAKALIFRAISGFLGSVGIPLPGLAEGGPAEKGKPYMVGERGPELFVPKAAGTVIPNDKLGTATASAPQQQPVVNNYTYNNNINAVDAKSVATLFYENRKALFGASNQARKEMPYGAAA